MQLRRMTVAFGLLAIATTQAQELLPVQSQKAPPALDSDALHQPDPFAGIRKPASRLYGADVAAQPNDHVFAGFRRDPQLVIGAKVTPHVALEAGYANLPDRGLHLVEQGKPADAAYVLGDKGSSNHVAAKVSSSKDERLSGYGKAGIAYSTVKRGEHAGSDTGLYTGAGAKYKVNKSTSVNGDYTQHGDAAKKFGRLSKDGIKANMTMGF